MITVQYTCKITVVNMYLSHDEYEPLPAGTPLPLSTQPQSTIETLANTSSLFLNLLPSSIHNSHSPRPLGFHGHSLKAFFPLVQHQLPSHSTSHYHGCILTYSAWVIWDNTTIICNGQINEIMDKWNNPLNMNLCNLHWSNQPFQVAPRPMQVYKYIYITIILLNNVYILYMYINTPKMCTYDSISAYVVHVVHI